MHILANNEIWSQPWFIIVALLLFFGSIVLVVILVKRAINKNKPKPKIDEEEVRNEQLNRVLEPITDEETIKQMQQFDEASKKKDESKEPTKDK